jgi:hypothetical protein
MKVGKHTAFMIDFVSDFADGLRSIAVTHIKPLVTRV